jgi:hypothetical protein
VDDFHFERSQCEHLSIFDELIGLPAGDHDRQHEHARLHIRLSQHHRVGGMEQDFYLGKRGGDAGMVGDVIVVGMREPQADHVIAARFGLIQQGADGVVGGVEENGLFGGLVGDEVAVGGGDAAGGGENFHRTIVGSALADGISTTRTKRR